MSMRLCDATRRWTQQLHAKEINAARSACFVLVAHKIYMKKRKKNPKQMKWRLRRNIQRNVCVRSVYTRWLMMSDEQAQHRSAQQLLLLFYWKLYQIAIKNGEKRNRRRRKNARDQIQSDVHMRNEIAQFAAHTERQALALAMADIGDWHTVRCFKREGLELRAKMALKLAQCELWTCSSRGPRRRRRPAHAQKHIKYDVKRHRHVFCAQFNTFLISAVQHHFSYREWAEQNRWEFVAIICE